MTWKQKIPMYFGMFVSNQPISDTLPPGKAGKKFVEFMEGNLTAWLRYLKKRLIPETLYLWIEVIYAVFAKTTIKGQGSSSTIPYGNRGYSSWFRFRCEFLFEGAQEFVWTAGYSRLKYTYFAWHWSCMSNELTSTFWMTVLGGEILIEITISILNFTRYMKKVAQL